MGIGGRLVELTKALYDGTTAAVKAADGTASSEFEIETGVKQRCSLSCILFNGVLDCIIRTASQKARPGVKIGWRLPRGRSCRGDRVQGEDIIGLSAYADDIAQWSDNLNELRESAKVLAKTLEHLQLIHQKLSYRLSSQKNLENIIQLTLY